MSEERKPLCQWIIGLSLGLLVLYVASFGPACWLCEHGILEQRDAWLAYRPVTWTWLNGPEMIRYAVVHYAHIWGDERRVYWSLGPHLEPESKSPLDYEDSYDFLTRRSR